MIPTADLCDEHGDKVQVLDDGYKSFGAVSAFHGPITTVSVFEDNSLVRDALEEAGQGRVLVVAGGGSRKCALVGGNLAELAADNVWAGILVDGCVRDASELATMEVAVRARGTCPRKSVKNGIGDRDVMVTVASANLRPGMWLWADEDGIVVADWNPERPADN